MKIVSLTKAQVAMGLRLGGLKECHIAEDLEQCGNLLIELSNDPDTGILLVDDEIARLHHKLIDDTKLSAGEGTDPLKDLIKRAIGVDITADKGSDTTTPKL
ncbi:MAG: V-type ATP synthase subunit F [Candidatus Heimdallarchaeota archaeon]